MPETTCVYVILWERTEPGEATQRFFTVHRDEVSADEFIDDRLVETFLGHEEPEGGHDDAAVIPIPANLALVMLAHQRWPRVPDELYDHVRALYDVQINTPRSCSILSPSGREVFFKPCELIGGSAFTAPKPLKASTLG